MNDTVTVSRELLRQIVDALRQCEFTTPPAQRKIVTDAKDALRAALEQPAPVQEQQPVAWMMKWPNHSPSFTTDKTDYVSHFAGKAIYPDDLVPLYTAQPRKAAKLTDEAIVDGFNAGFQAGMRAEQALYEPAVEHQVMVDALEAWANDLERGFQVCIPAASLRKIAQALEEPAMEPIPADEVTDQIRSMDIDLREDLCPFSFITGVRWAEKQHGIVGG